MRRFAAYVKDRVNLIRIETRDVDHALRIFETINSRGIGLNPMDLLKNLIFMKSKRPEFEKISENWKMAMTNIEDSGEPPSRFLIYFVLAFYSDKPINENQIYNWFLANEDIYKSPLVFSVELLKASAAFRNFSSGKNADGSENNYLQSLKLMNSKSTRHLILMLAVSKKSSEVADIVAKFLENLLFIHAITSTNTRNLDTKFVEWSRVILKMDKPKDIANFLESQQVHIRQAFSDRFREAFLGDSFGVTHRTRLRYILGKMSQFVNEHAYGSSGAEGKIQTFVNTDVEIEHILPKNPSNAARKEFGDNTSISSFQNRLGNLVLIEKPLNRHLGNKAYSQKKPIYDESKFLLTKSLSGEHDIGNTMVTKAVGGLKSFEKWDADSLSIRTNQLFEIAKKVWDMQPPASDS